MKLALFRVFRVFSGKNKSKSINTFQFATDDELVGGFGAFVYDHAIEVQHVAV